MAVILKYSESVYQEKISSLQQLKARLQGNLDNLEGLHNEINSFWHDDAAAQYIIAIANAIAKVKKANDDVDGLSMVHQDSVDQLARMGNAVDEVVEDVGAAVGKVVDVASKVGSLLVGL